MILGRDICWEKAALTMRGAVTSETAVGLHFDNNLPVSRCRSENSPPFPLLQGRVNVGSGHVQSRDMQGTQIFEFASCQPDPGGMDMVGSGAQARAGRLHLCVIWF